MRLGISVEQLDALTGCPCHKQQADRSAQDDEIRRIETPQSPPPERGELEGAAVTRLAEMNAEARDDEKERHAVDRDPHHVNTELFEDRAGKTVRRRRDRMAERDRECGDTAKKID